MSIKQKTFDLAKEHGIEIEMHLGELYEYIIGLPKGFELPDGRTGYSGLLEPSFSHYQNYKIVLEDVQELVAEKSSWRKITSDDAVEFCGQCEGKGTLTDDGLCAWCADASSIDQLIVELKTTRKQKSKAGA